jgi:two-component sensor histidine kinase
MLPRDVSAVYITDELARRRSPAPDYHRESLALCDLARNMVDDPRAVLPTLVDRALAMCGAASGGISLFEPDPAPGVFRWHYLRGDFARFHGVTTPRHYSPCGITLDRGGPVLAKYPERAYDWLAEANVKVPECLLVPIYLGGSEPLGTLWIVSRDEDHFDSSHAEIMSELAGMAGIAVKMVENEDRLKQALFHQKTLTGEMAHRVKNTLAVIDAMMRAASRRLDSPGALADNISGRLRALAMAHSLVTPSELDVTTSSNVDLGELLRTILQPYESASALEGPPIALGPRAANNLALVFHELATNAAKYGALCEGCGRVTAAWQISGDALRLRWQEHDGPLVAGEPAQLGFGSLLTQRSVGTLGGSMIYHWQEAGLIVEMTLPLEHLSA